MSYGTRDPTRSKSNQRLGEGLHIITHIPPSSPSNEWNLSATQNTSMATSLVLSHVCFCKCLGIKKCHGTALFLAGKCYQQRMGDARQSAGSTT